MGIPISCASLNNVARRWPNFVLLKLVFLACRTSRCVVRVPRISILKSSMRFQISICVIPPLCGLLSLLIGSLLDAFLFEFDVLCRGYDYTTDPKNLKLFPSTLKGVDLRWFMGLGGRTINSWEEMKTSFLKI